MVFRFVFLRMCPPIDDDDGKAAAGGRVVALFVEVVGPPSTRASCSFFTTQALRSLGTKRKRSTIHGATD